MWKQLVGAGFGAAAGIGLWAYSRHVSSACFVEGEPSLYKRKDDSVDESAKVVDSVQQLASRCDDRAPLSFLGESFPEPIPLLLVSAVTAGVGAVVAHYVTKGAQ